MGKVEKVETNCQCVASTDRVLGRNPIANSIDDALLGLDLTFHGSYLCPYFRSFFPVFSRLRLVMAVISGRACNCGRVHSLGVVRLTERHCVTASDARYKRGELHFDSTSARAMEGVQ